METEKLYYQDPYLTAFTARVLSCEKSKSGWAVVLDRTAFYPEGGGQPADHGSLGAVQVTDVHETKGVIFHTCDGPMEIGTQVAGAVDWPRRFDHMQQHSGEHILSGLLCSLYHCDNVGFHLGADTVTIDYNAELTWEQVMAAEKAANEVIWQDTPVDITFPAPDALARLNYRSKKALTGQVRIVAFPGADCCACCGTHVRRAGEVGIIKVLSCQKFREGVRLEILCGSRAYRYLSQVYDQDRAVAQLLSVKPQDTLAAAERQAEELAAIHRIHTPQQTDQAAGLARKAKFNNLSLDLIYGLPGQTMDSWKATVEHALSLIPQHLSCYGLKVEEGTPLARRVAEGEVLPDDDQQADLYLWMVGRLARAGYPQYEISNFAKPGFESRHNLRYWFTRPYIGFGPGAHSDFGGRRYSFVRDLDAYIDGVLHGGNVIDSSELIPQRERCGEYLMLRLRTAQGIDGVEYRRNYFMDFAPLEARLEQFAAQGWVERSPEGRWHFTPKGFLVSNQLIGDLLDRQEQASWEDLIVRPERGPRP